MERLLKVIDMWKVCINTKEVHLIGDINLDFLNNTDSDKQKLIDIIEEEILQNGSKKIELGDTFFRGNIVRSLDHLYSSKPEKLYDIRTLDKTTSDHYPSVFTRYTKKVVSNPKYIKISNFSKMDFNEMSNELSNDPQIIYAEMVDDTNIATTNLQEE